MTVELVPEAIKNLGGKLGQIESILHVRRTGVWGRAGIDCHRLKCVPQIFTWKPEQKGL